ncbi:MAG: hypothetical protein QM755_02075 [Luteolibacter sp.]
MTPSRTSTAKALLWLAVILISLAQLLPWEHVPMNYWASPTYVAGSAITGQVPHYWTFHQSSTTSPTLDQRAHYDGIWFIRVSPEEIPKEMPSYLIQDLWTFGNSLLATHPTASYLLSKRWPTVLLIIWPAAFLALFAMPFLTRPFGHSRATLWLVRALVAAMLIWLIWNLSVAFRGKISPDYGRIGLGQWLTLIALLVEIIGLFLIPKLRLESISIKPDTLLPSHE